MEIHNVSNLPSDTDITVILVKKSLNQYQVPKSGDCKNFSANTSLVNFAAHKPDGIDDTSSLSSESSLDVDMAKAVDRCEIANKTCQISSVSIKHQHLFSIRETPRSSNCDVKLKTIQNAYAETEPEHQTEDNCSSFVDVDLTEPSVQDSPGRCRAAVRGEPETRRESKTLFSACFPCVFKGTHHEDD